MTCIAAIHFFYGGVIISKESLKCSICQRNSFYFTTLVAAIDYSKRSVELERYVQVQLFTKYSKFFRRAIVKICFCKGEFSICNLYTYFLRNSCSFGVLIVLIFFWGMQFWGTSTLQLHSLELVIWSR